MVKIEEVNAEISKMILSASGWRGIFASQGGEEGRTDQINEAHRIISAAAAFVFAEYLRTSCENPSKSRLILVGTDSRPTGSAIAKVMIQALFAAGCDVSYAGIAAAPEIMAWARSRGAGFIYISASHNPIGYNGIKFGLADGGVLEAEKAVELISNFRAFLNNDDCIEKIEKIISSTDDFEKLTNTFDAAKAEAREAYFDFCSDVVWGGNTSIAAVSKNGLMEKPVGVVCDFNGSARTVSIDRDFYSAIGLKFECINGEPGQIAHCIVPEGEALEPCRKLLEDAHRRDASFMIGYVPDCDGDRGNLVIWDDALSKARILEAQEVFALACVSEFSHLVWTDEYAGGSKKAAVAVNDPTSMRVDRIAESFDIQVFRAEVGEANVVGLARKLRENGYIVRILGEGSAGGNITHPSAVRDPLNTVLAVVKLLSVRSSAEKPGLFEIWCKVSGQMDKYRDNFNIADIVSSLPRFATTPAYSNEAVLRIKTNDHSLLKKRYQKVFTREWEKRKDELKEEYGFCGWEAIAYNGMEEKRRLSRFEEAGRGGLKICFLNENGRETAYIWMRGSATEPVFRIMADAEDTNGQGSLIERFLLNWQRDMIMESDRS